MRKLALLAAAVALIAIASTGQPEVSSADESMVPGVLLVRYRDGAEASHTRVARAANYNPLLGLWRLDVGEARFDQVLAELSTDPTVELVQPQYRYTHATEPSDPLYRSTQHVHFRAINLQPAWNLGTPFNEVIVAVIDGGVDVTHPDLDSRTWTNPAEVANGLDDDANGCVDDIKGCSFQSAIPDGDIADRDGHGTFGAGLIAAERNNGEYVAGVAANARIMPVRALDPAGAGFSDQLAGSILYAARNGASILNLSLALREGFDPCITDPLVQSALQEAVELHGVTVLAAAGNNDVGCVSFPASSDFTIAVSGSGPAEATDSRAFFSQWGPEVDVTAPAVGLVSLCPVPTPVTTPYCPGTPTGLGDGTSFSTPIAAGVAALVLGQNPAWTPAQVRQRLKETARDLPDEGELNWDGAGIIDAGAALGAGTAWSSLDARGDELSLLSARVLVGDPGAPVCEARKWDQPDFQVVEAASTFGVGECGAYFPPGPDQPWRLIVSSHDGKANMINSWRVESGGLSCQADGLPAYAPPAADTVITIECSGNAVVANDEPESALTVAADLPRQYQQDSRYATAIGDPVATCGPHTRSVWYRVPAALAAQGLVVDTLGASFDSLVAIYRDDGGSLTEVACNDSVNYPIIPQSRVAFVGDGTSEYVVMVSAFFVTRATVMRVNFSAIDHAANDEAASPVALTIDSEKQIQPAHSALRSPADPDFSCTGVYGTSLWFTVMASTGGPVTARTTGSTYNTVMAVYDDTTEVGCNNNEMLNQDSSKVTWTAEAGKTYTVVVGSFLNRTGGVLHIAAHSGP